MNAFTPLFISIQSSKSFKWLVISTGTCAAFLAVGTSVYFVFQLVKEGPTVVVTEVDTTPDTSIFIDPNEYEIQQLNMLLTEQAATTPERLKTALDTSRLYFMLAKRGNVGLSHSYIYEGNSFSPSRLSDATDLFYSLSLNGSRMTYFVLEKSIGAGSRKDWDQYTKAYVSYVGRFASPAFPETLADARVMSSKNIESKQLPAVSDDGKVVFVGWLGDYSPGIEEASRWSIFRAVSDTETDHVLRGYMPKWINNISFLYLKTDGIYIADSDTFTESKLHNSDKIVYSNNRLDISDDGKTLIWVRHDDGEVVVFDIRNENDKITLTKRGAIKIAAFTPWAVISPSAEYLAIQTQSWEVSERDSPKPKIEFYDLATLQKITGLTIDLSSFEHKNIFMTDWVERVE